MSCLENGQTVAEQSMNITEKDVIRRLVEPLRSQFTSVSATKIFAVNRGGAAEGGCGACRLISSAANRGLKGAGPLPGDEPRAKRGVNFPWTEWKGLSPIALEYYTRQQLLFFECLQPRAHRYHAPWGMVLTAVEFHGSDDSTRKMLAHYRLLRTATIARYQLRDSDEPDAPYRVKPIGRSRIPLNKKSTSFE